MSRYLLRYCDYTRTNIRYVPILRFPDIVSSRHNIVSFQAYPDIVPDIGKIGDDIGSISGHTRFLPNPILRMPDIGFFPDIGSDIGSMSGHTRFLPNPILRMPDIGFFPDIGSDIGSMSGYTRFLPNTISGFSPISCPTWTRYCKNLNIGLYGYRDQKKPQCRLRCVCNMAIYRCLVLQILGQNTMSGPMPPSPRRPRPGWPPPGHCLGTTTGPVS
jgi:hypothetical protein